MITRNYTQLKHKNILTLSSLPQKILNTLLKILRYSGHYNSFTLPRRALLQFYDIHKKKIVVTYIKILITFFCVDLCENFILTKERWYIKTKY